MRLIFAATLLCALTISAHPQSGNSRNNTPPKQQTEQSPSLAKRTKTVTVNLTKGEAVSGKFLSADADTVQIEVAGNQLKIKLDEVASLIFTQAITESPAHKAVKSLKSLATATEVGINNRDYSNRLIEVKTVIDEQLPLIPEGDLKKAISDAFKAYQSASEIWDLSLKLRSTEDTRRLREETLTTAWGIARKRLEQAEALLMQ